MGYNATQVIQIILIKQIIILLGAMPMKGPKGKYAWTVKVGEKGQFVIPKEAREIFGIEPGDTLILLADEEKGIAIPPKNTFGRFAEAIFGQSDENEDEDK